jgi:hypothetical protein
MERLKEQIIAVSIKVDTLQSKLNYQRKKIKKCFASGILLDMLKSIDKSNEPLHCLPIGVPNWKHFVSTEENFFSLFSAPHVR